MNHTESQECNSEEFARYWQNLSRRLQLPDKPPPPTSTKASNTTPLEHPVSLSLRRLIAENRINEAQKVLQAHAGGATYAGFLRRQRDNAGPQAIVSPSSEQELVSIMLWAAQRDIKVLPWGTGTAPYAGKSLNGDPFIVVKLDQMNRLLLLDNQERIIKMQAGATWQMTRARAEREGFVLGTSCPRGDSTLGGSIATNIAECSSPGSGALTDDIAQIRTITPAGPVSLPGPASPIKNLLGLILGSRGAWGIVTEAALHLYPRPEKQIHLLASFPSRSTAITALAEVSHHQHHVTAARLVDMETIKLFGTQSDPQRIFAPRTWLNNGHLWEARLYVEIAGSRDAVSGTRRRIEDLLRKHDAAIESNSRAAHLTDGLWHRYRPLWRNLWLRGVLTHRLTTTVPWSMLPSFLLAWEDALSSVLLSSSGVAGLPITTIHALRHCAQLDTLLLGQQPSGDLLEKIEQLEAIQAVAMEINRRWNIAAETTPLISKALSAARDVLDLSDVMVT